MGRGSGGGEQELRPVRAAPGKTEPMDNKAKRGRFIKKSFKKN